MQGEFLKTYFCMSNKHYFSMPERLGLAMSTFMDLISFHLSSISKGEESLEMVTLILFPLYSLI